MTDVIDQLLAKIDEAVDATTLAALWGAVASIAGDTTETGRQVHAIAAAWTNLACAEMDLARGDHEDVTPMVECTAAIWLPQIPEGEPRRRLEIAIHAHRMLAADRMCTSDGGVC